MARLLLFPIESVRVLGEAEERMSLRRDEAAQDSIATESSSSSVGNGARVFGDSTTTWSGTELYWRDLADHPEHWWDNRNTRRNSRAPDFKHRVSRKSLWLDNLQTPEWARIKFVK